MAKNSDNSVSNRQESVINTNHSVLLYSHIAANLNRRAVGSSKVPKVPVAEFARLKESSPEKKQKTAEVVLHTVDIKRVKSVFRLFLISDR
jgi:hypothetical protein